MYALGALSNARDAIKAAAFSMFEDTLPFVNGLLVMDGFNGNGGGALSGSELSHLSTVSILGCLVFITHIGMFGRFMHSEYECVCLTSLDSLLSRELSLP